MCAPTALAGERCIFFRISSGGDRAQTLAVVEHQGTECGAAECVRLFQDRIEHWGGVARRAVDDMQHLCQGGLAGERFVALGGALVEFSPEDGNGLLQIGRRVVEHCHSVRFVYPQVPAGTSQRSTFGCRAARTPRPSGTHALRARIPVRSKLRKVCFFKAQDRICGRVRYC
jgi:hypothetical protein